MPDFTFTEATVGLSREAVRTRWALWVHDDEVPSDALLARLAGPAPRDSVQSAAIPRRWAWYAPGERLCFGASPQWQDRTGRHGMDHTFRLFRPHAVTFVAAMHSEGFRIESWGRLPPDHYIVHFEWVIRSMAQRRAKLRLYDRARDGFGRFFESMYLPELQPAGFIDYTPFETDAFDALAEAYWRARQPPGPIPKRTLREWWRRWRGFAAGRLGLVDFRRDDPDRSWVKPRPELEVPDWT